MLEAVVFDFDGVIADSEPLHYRAFLDSVRPLGIDFDYAQYNRRYIGYDDRDGLRAICADHGMSLDDARLAELIDAKGRAFERAVGEGAAAVPGSVALIRQAAARWPIAISSGALRSDIAAVLPGLAPGEDLTALFSAIVTADDVERSKPDPASYALAVERLALRPAGCLAIEDTPAGLQSARAAGLRTLAVATTHAAAQLAPMADRVVESLKDMDADRLARWYSD